MWCIIHKNLTKCIYINTIKKIVISEFYIEMMCKEDSLISVAGNMVDYYVYRCIYAR